MNEKEVEDNIVKRIVERIEVVMVQKGKEMRNRLLKRVIPLVITVQITTRILFHFLVGW